MTLRTHACSVHTPSERLSCFRARARLLQHDDHHRQNIFTRFRFFLVDSQSGGCFMIVRIRLGTGRPIQRKLGKNRHLALACGALLVPVSLMAYVLGFWRLAADMGFAAEPGITGVFAHWQVWIGTAVFLHVASTMLNRYGRRGLFEIPQVLNPRILPLRATFRRRARSG
jgi:hypothetical protein